MPISPRVFGQFALRPDYTAAPVLQLSMDAILASCPSPQEVAAIQRDFSFSFESPASLQCVNNGLESGVMLTLINAFRCMRALTFDTPMPLIGARNLYSWLKEHRVAIHVMAAGSEENSWADPLSKIATLNIANRTLEGAEKRIWNARLEWKDVSSGGHMQAVIALIVHEAAHAILGKSHDCSGATTLYNPGYRSVIDGPCFQDGRYLGDPRFPPGGPEVCPSTLYAPDGSILFRTRKYHFTRSDGSGYDWPIFVNRDDVQLHPDDPIFKMVPDVWNNDSSLEYGGAWAAQYWFNRWLAEHSGLYLSEDEKRWASKDAAELLASGRLSCGQLARAPQFAPARGAAFPTVFGRVFGR